MREKTPNQESMSLLIDVLSSLGGEYKLLSELFHLLGRENTMKLLVFFTDMTIKFPSEHIVQTKLDHVRGFILYRVYERSWEEVIEELYGNSATVSQRRSLRDSIKGITQKLATMDIDLSVISTKSIEAIEDDLEFVKEEVGRSERD